MDETDGAYTEKLGVIGGIYPLSKDEGNPKEPEWKLKLDGRGPEEINSKIVSRRDQNLRRQSRHWVVMESILSWGADSRYIKDNSDVTIRRTPYRRPRQTYENIAHSETERRKSRSANILDGIAGAIARKADARQSRFAKAKIRRYTYA